MKPFSLLIKPAGPDCNMSCKYCFYSGKKSLFGPGKHRMSEEILQRLIEDYVKLGLEVSSFAWQGGEPTLMGLDFYRKVVELQQEYGRDGQVVSNALQTNGILLDSNWCEFLAKYSFLVGISLDGPKGFHDHYRLDKTDAGTFERVMRGIENCRTAGVEFNILVLLNDRNIEHPDELFDFFVEHNFKYLQFIPCVEKDFSTGGPADFSIEPSQYGNFLCRLFDLWRKYGPEKLSIRLFDSILSMYLHGRQTVCTFGRKCDDYLVVEHNGDVFCCDFFVCNRWRLGNIERQSIKVLAACDTKREFALNKRRYDNKCFLCRHNTFCQGGCLKDRMVFGGDFTRHSYLCGAYQQFFDYSLAGFSQIAAKLAIQARPSR
ncbi:MAG: anaerobic sulfatase maturase [Planctomycetota bacterium]